MLRGNEFYKIASVVVAMALAVYVNGERNPFDSRTFALQLSAVNKAPNVLIKSIPKLVQVEITGPRQSINQINAADLRAMVNLEDRGPGEYKLKVIVGGQDTGTLPPDVTPSPLDTIATVVLEPIIKQVRTLEPVFLRPAPAGFSYGLPSVQPSVAYITGSKDQVTKVVRLSVVVDAQVSAKHPVSGRFPIQAVDITGAIVPDVKISPSSAGVQCPIQRMPAQKEVLISPSITGNPVPSMRIVSIQVVPQSILVTGSPEALTRLNFVGTQEIDITGAVQNIIRSVQILLPDSVTPQGPRRVRVEVVLGQRNL